MDEHFANAYNIHISHQIFISFDKDSLLRPIYLLFRQCEVNLWKHSTENKRIRFFFSAYVLFVWKICLFLLSQAPIYYHVLTKQMKEWSFVFVACLLATNWIRLMFSLRFLVHISHTHTHTKHWTCKHNRQTIREGDHIKRPNILIACDISSFCSLHGALCHLMYIFIRQHRCVVRDLCSFSSFLLLLLLWLLNSIHFGN